MKEFFSSAKVVDLALGLMALEAVLLAGYYALRRKSILPVNLAYNLLSGACLLLALRGALVEASWHWIAVCLSAALLSHVADLRSRLRTSTAA